jgi:mRNA interferase MazF
VAGSVSRRGDLVIVSASGAYTGKPRPAVVVQSDHLPPLDSVLVALFTTTIVDAPLYRLSIAPTQANGLVEPSQIMVDKIVALPRGNCGPAIGRLDDAALIVLNRMLSTVLGLAD